MHALRKIYQPLVQMGIFLQPFLLLLLRLHWGWLLFFTGLGKWENPDRVAEFFSSLNLPIPYFTAYFVGTIELLGGLFLFFGFLSRLSALFVSLVMITAYATAHREALMHFFTEPSQFVNEPPFMFLLVALIVFCFGPGVFSIDWLGRRWCFKEK